MSTPVPSEVALHVGPDGLRVDVFDRYSIDLSMLEVGTAFTFSLWYSEQARASWQLLTHPERGLKLGQVVTVTVDGDAVLSGIVEEREVGDGGDGRGTPVFVISGRDELGPASTWHADPALSLAGRALEDALTDLYRGVGIVPEVSESVDAATRVGTLRQPRRGSRTRRTSRRQLIRMKHPRIGEAVHAVAERIVRALGFRIWTAPGVDTARTSVIIDRPRTSGPVRFSLLREFRDGRVTHRGNIESGREKSSIRNVPTSVTVLAHAPRGDAQAAMIARTVANQYLLTATAAARVDPNTPPRPRYVESQQARTVAAAQNEAGRICAEANESFRTYEATVLGHRHEGLLWAPNSRVAVRDELAGIDETMTLVHVSLSGSRAEGQSTSLRLLPEGALTEIPHPSTGQ